MEASGNIYECKAKGLFRKNNITPMVGDQAEITVCPGQENVISGILPRKNQFVRPPVANVDVVLVVSAAADPQPNYLMIDKLIVMAEKNEADVVLVFNKSDRADPDFLQQLKSRYRNTHYPLHVVSAAEGKGIAGLRRDLSGKKSMLAGPSGVGKSSLANALGGFEMQTGSISEKTLRGKHTTRHVELLTGEEGLNIFDTPGFTSFSLLEMEASQLKAYYPEFAPWEEECRFKSCVHASEPDCGVKMAVEEGKISRQRYETYLKLYQELQDKRKAY